MAKAKKAEQITAPTTLEICQELAAIRDKLEEQGGELLPGDLEALQQWQASREVKVQNCALLIDQIDAEIGHFNGLGERIKARVKLIETTKARVKQLILAMMSADGTTKIKAEGVFTVSVCAGRSRVVIDNEGALEIGKYADMIEIVKPCTDAIKSALEAGETVPGAHLEYGESYLRII
jgi:hypothetical protein